MQFNAKFMKFTNTLINKIFFLIILFNVNCYSFI